MPGNWGEGGAEQKQGFPENSGQLWRVTVHEYANWAARAKQQGQGCPRALTGEGGRLLLLRLREKQAPRHDFHQSGHPRGGHESRRRSWGEKKKSFRS